MQAYKQAAEQLQEDIAEEYIRSFPKVPREKVLEDCENGKLVFDNIEIVFKNSAKYKIFSQRVRHEKKSILEGDDLLYAYLSTSEDDSYNDSLESAKCCKKISYFLFTSRYDKFTLAERNKYQDILHKYQNRLPTKAVDLYNNKKTIIGHMREGKPTYNTILPLVVRHITLLKEILESQTKIYQVEYKLEEHFKTYLDKVLIPLFQTPGFKFEPANAKALVQTLKELQERGVEIEEFKDKVTTQLFESTITILTEHMDCLKAEINTIQEVTTFLDDIITFADPPASVKQAKEKQTEASFMASIRDKITSGFAEWLNS